MDITSYHLHEIYSGMNVLMRIDGNVPLKNGRIVRHGDHRLRVLIPEIKRLVNRGANVTLMTHVGRPNGKEVSSLSTRPIERYMQRHVSSKINVKENLRFDKGEVNDSKRFAKALAKGFDIYINNAFGVSHRKHASVHAIAQYIDSRAGHLLREELKQLSKRYRHPSTLIVGGIKLKTKIPVIEHLSERLNNVLTGGGVAAALTSVITEKRLYAGGHAITQDDLAQARRILELYGDQIHMPIDYRVSRKKTIGKLSVKYVSELRSGDRLFDIGPQTQEEYGLTVDASRTIIWNGPLGLVEEKAAAKGTTYLADHIAKKRWARTIVGGGDTVSYIDKLSLIKKFTHVSTGGGAMLAYLGGKDMPGIDVLLT